MSKHKNAMELCYNAQECQISTQSSNVGLSYWWFSIFPFFMGRRIYRPIRSQSGVDWTAPYIERAYFKHRCLQSFKNFTYLSKRGPLKVEWDQESGVLQRTLVFCLELHKWRPVCHQWPLWLTKHADR